MTTPGFGPQIDGQWIDYYALLEVPAGADEDSIRRRIGKVYADAAANGDHRNPARRDYYRALVERVLPQCRRVMLDAQWRERYDEQHRLHREQNGTAQNYVEFVSSMRGHSSSGLNQTELPQIAQREVEEARRVVQTALSGAELDLLPSQAISQRNAPDAVAASANATANVAANAIENAVASEAASASADFSGIPQMNAPQSAADTATAQAEPQEEPVENIAPRGKKRRNIPTEFTPTTSPVISPAHNAAMRGEIVAQVTAVTPASLASAVVLAAAPMVESAVAQSVQPVTVESSPVELSQSDDVVMHRQPGEAARATVITAQEAADIRRRRASNPNGEPYVGPDSRAANSKKRRSRVVVDADKSASSRKLSPTSLNLMVAICGVFLTIVIQRFAATPAVATSAGRTPIVLAVAPEIESALQRASLDWQKTPAGAPYEIVVEGVESRVALQRALGKSGDQIDGWIPATSGYAQRFNELASAAKRPALQIGDSLAQTPIVLVARADKAAALRAAFPDHKISTWAALRSAVMSGAGGRFGLSDPRQSLPGALARYSMAREWGATQGKAPDATAKNPNFWKWMAGFEENIPSSAASSDAMVKDMVLGTTGRYYWAIAYESDALKWSGQGKALELYYLPRTALADHPFCAVERVGAPLEVSGGRAAFIAYLKSDAAQKALLQNGFRPAEISPSTAVDNNPFTGADARARGVQLQGLPRDERFNIGALGTIQKQWSDFYG